MRRALRAICLLCVFAMQGQCVNASVLVLVADHLTLTDITNPALPHLARFCREGQLAVMSPGLPRGADPVATAYATLGAGDTVQPRDISAGLLARTLQSAHIPYAVIGGADGDDIGLYRPLGEFLPNLALSLQGHAAGERADPTFPGGNSIDPGVLSHFALTNLPRFGLVAVHDGDFSQIERENRAGLLLPRAYRLHRAQALRNLDTLVGLLLDGIYLDRATAPARPVTTVILIVPTPPLLPNGTWNQLTPFVEWTPGTPPVVRAIASSSITLSAAPATASSSITQSAASGTAWSDTTQTPGLVAARDIAPTLLSALGIASPITMTGAVIREFRPSSGTVNVRKAVESLDRNTWLNMAIQLPFFWGIGIIGAATVFIGIFLVLSGLIKTGGPGVRYWLYCLRLQAAWPLALLLAPVLSPATVSVYVSEIILITLLLAIIPTPEWIFGLTAIVVVVDGLCGSPLVGQSVLSCYALSGIRFYGIGNEYMGLLLGGALMLCVGGALAPGPSLSTRGGLDEARTSPSLSLERRGIGVGPPLNPPLSTGGRLGGSLMPVAFRPWAGRIGILVWFALVVFVLSFPAYGAKAGGAVTALATFTMAWRGLTGRPARIIHLVLAIVAGFALVFVWALTSSALGLRTTHVQTAVTALLHGRLGYIFGVVLRKSGLAVHVLLHPGTLWGIFAFILLGAVARFWLWPKISGYLAERPRFAAVFVAGLWGCLVALLFNDSGAVAAILLGCTLILPLIHGIFSKPNHAPSRP